MSRPSVFLLVEDSEDDVYFMQRAFRHAGLQNQLHVVNDGEQAIEYLSGQSNFADRDKHPLPDMIFLDLKMPGLNGFDRFALDSQTRQMGRAGGRFNLISGRKGPPKGP